MPLSFDPLLWLSLGLALYATVQIHLILRRLDAAPGQSAVQAKPPQLAVSNNPSSPLPFNRSAKFTVQHHAVAARYIAHADNAYSLKIWNCGHHVIKQLRLELPAGQTVLCAETIAAHFPMEQLNQFQSIDLPISVDDEAGRLPAIALSWLDDQGQPQHAQLAPGLSWV
ncbi:hypothetical protein [Ferrimonas pelagia]|uniref:Uncharacterized protein n=1 Tax=Ferrimonas pelagia TaxID=1177826 RepID=A0ABP9EBQ2_9GAMM